MLLAPLASLLAAETSKPNIIITDDLGYSDVSCYGAKKVTPHLFRHRFIATLRREKLISEKKVRQLLGWKHSGLQP